MPIYEFQCRKCGKRFDEFFHTMGEAARTPPCPKCKSKRVERLLSLFGMGGGSKSSSSGGGSSCGSCSRGSCAGCRH